MKKPRNKQPLHAPVPPNPQPDLVPLEVYKGGVVVLGPMLVPRKDVPTVATALAEKLFGNDTPAPPTKTRPGPPRSSERFERGLFLVMWMDSPRLLHKGRLKGKLTKKLILEIEKRCESWPEVLEYRQHKSLEKLRNQLRTLATSTREALEKHRCPLGWSATDPR